MHTARMLPYGGGLPNSENISFANFVAGGNKLLCIWPCEVPFGSFPPEIAIWKALNTKHQNMQ